MTALARIEYNQASILKRLSATDFSTTEKQGASVLGSPFSTLKEFNEFDNTLADEKTRKLLVSLQKYYLYVVFCLFCRMEYNIIDLWIK